MKFLVTLFSLASLFLQSHDIRHSSLRRPKCEINSFNFILGLEFRKVAVLLVQQTRQCASVSSKDSRLQNHNPPLSMGEVPCRRRDSRQLKAGRVRLLAAVVSYQMPASECKSSFISLSSSKYILGVIIVRVVVITVKQNRFRCKRNLFLRTPLYYLSFNS